MLFSNTTKLHLIFFFSLIKATLKARKKKARKDITACLVLVQRTSQIPSTTDDTRLQKKKKCAASQPRRRAAIKRKEKRQKKKHSRYSSRTHLSTYAGGKGLSMLSNFSSADSGR